MRDEDGKKIPIDLKEQPAFKYFEMWMNEIRD